MQEDEGRHDLSAGEDPEVEDAPLAEVADGEPVSDEEFAAMEKELLATVRQFYQAINELTESIAAEHPDIAEKLESSAGSVLLNVELATSGDGGPGSSGSA